MVFESPETIPMIILGDASKSNNCGKFSMIFKTNLIKSKTFSN